MDQIDSGRSARHVGLAWVLLVAWSGLIWGLASLPSVPSAGSRGWDFAIRQGGHLGMHMVLAWLAWRVGTITWSRRAGWMFAACLALPHAVLDELYQGMVPGRDANLEDVLYNCAGVVVGLVAIWVLGRYRTARFWTRTGAGARMDEEAHHR